MKPRSTSASADALAETANTVMNPIRATPMSSADAVAEVRLGMRTAFSVARRPVMPRRRGAARRAAEEGAGEDGADDDHAATMSRAPRPTVGSGSVSSSCHALRVELAEHEQEDAERDARLDAPDRSMATSRSAASGGTRVARIAGRMAAISVTPRPMPRAIDDGGRLTTRPDVGRSTPDASRPAVTGGEGDAAEKPSTADNSPMRRPRAGPRQHLPPAGADGPEQGQLACALGHEDREGVGDDEVPTKQGDDGEDREEQPEEGEALLRVGVLGRPPPRR